MSIVAQTPTKVDNFEELLKLRSSLGNNNVKQSDGTVITTESVEPTKAKKNATLEDMMEMLSLIVSKCMRKDKVEFKPDEGARLSTDQATKVEHPYICYEVIDRSPDMEIKPREREEIQENTTDKNSNRPGMIFGQRFHAIVQFNIFAADYKTANKTMNDFENLMFNYVSYLKENGIAEIIFDRQLTDNNLDMYRQSFSIRSLRYRVVVEKLYTRFTSDIKGILTE